MYAREGVRKLSEFDLLFLETLATGSPNVSPMSASSWVTWTGFSDSKLTFSNWTLLAETGVLPLASLAIIFSFPFVCTGPSKLRLSWPRSFVSAKISPASEKKLTLPDRCSLTFVGLAGLCRCSWKLIHPAFNQPIKSPRTAHSVNCTREREERINR